MGVIVPCAVLLPIAIALYKHAYWNTPAKFILAFLLLSATFNLIARLTAHSNNLPYLHLYSVLEFSVLFGFFRSLISATVIRRLFLAGILLFPLMALFFLLTQGSIYAFNHIPRFISSMLITISSVCFLLKDIGSIQSDFSMFLFTVLTGLLLYYTTCSTLFIFSNELMHLPKAKATIIWNIHASFNLLMYLLIAFGFYQLKRSDE